MNEKKYVEKDTHYRQKSFQEGIVLYETYHQKYVHFTEI